jgi:hypothetical protein
LSVPTMGVMKRKIGRIIFRSIFADTIKKQWVLMRALEGLDEGTADWSYVWVHISNGLMLVTVVML